MVGEPLVVAGSMGQMREHPLLSEVRQQRAFLNASLRQLKLPELDEAFSASQRSHAARNAARSRWATHYGSHPGEGA